MENTLKTFLLLIAAIAIVACNAQSSPSESKQSNEETVNTAEISSTNNDADAKKNIIDLGVNSNGLTTNAQKQRFQDICDAALKQGKLSNFISPLRDTGEPAFHLEIPQ